MAFEGIASKLQSAFRKLSGKGKLTEADIKETMREIKLALLEADVSFAVVKSFIKTVSERAVGTEVLQSLTPDQQIIKIVNEELIALMGNTGTDIDFGTQTPAVILLAGLQGAGKTTMAGKLGAYLEKRYGKSCLLVGCDIYRPAAIDQLKVVGGRVNIPVFERGTQDPVKTAKEAISEANRLFKNVVIIDTAGRLAIDEAMMDEIRRVKEAVNPIETILVVDAMTGQDAVNVAKGFNDVLDITGVILTKLDGDARGGAALSVRATTGKPIKFCGIGEKMTDLEPFYPDRMASRILGMGDVLTLIEKAQENFNEENARKLEQKMRKNTFDLEDYLAQLNQIKKMGSIQDILGMLPGINASDLSDAEIDESILSKTEAIILSMTPYERTHPDSLNASRKKRIAAGSGTTPQDVNKLLKQFDEVKKLTRSLAGFGKKRGFKKRGFNLPGRR